jgi:hypothetical protein
MTRRIVQPDLLEVAALKTNSLLHGSQAWARARDGQRRRPRSSRGALIDMIRTNRSKPGKSLLKNPFTKF